ncbi:rhamnogalacturonan acetylesterase [Brachybacterium sp. YJGR34]|uniref:rhamnogalacturonan acetylesterase n=1 Tax=Brachybacterium sp. YJGR34 TaxID=2059911 RepID=UPI000E0A985F|nr:rhamnogalacturonan acetylesterase [Brachybacterium sp. YJGR34]
MRAAAARPPRVIVAGDSTAAPYVATAYPMCGWGAHLGAALTARLGAGPLHVVDLAKNGASTESHRAEGLWAGVLDASAAGDLVVIQFGHNDQKREHLDPFGGYTANLTRMVEEVRDRGARPVLCTPVARRHYEDGTLLHTHAQYPAAVIALAAQLDVPLLDLNTRTRALYAELGEEGSRRLFTQLPAGVSPLYPEGIEDNTHFSVDGAITVAQIVAELLAPIAREALRGEGTGALSGAAPRG